MLAILLWCEDITDFLMLGFLYFSLIVEKTLAILAYANKLRQSDTQLVIKSDNMTNRGKPK
jgi:hypothetical protein